MKIALHLCGCLCLLCLAWLFLVLPVALDEAVKREAEATRQAADAAIAREAEATRIALLIAQARLSESIQAESRKWRSAALGQVLYLLLTEVRPVREEATVAIRRYSDAATDVSQLAKNANASWDDLYYDVSAAVQSGTVAMRGVAEASEAVGKAAPELVANGTRMTAETAGIAADVHTVTSKLTAPKSLPGKLWEALKLATSGVAAWF